MKEKHDIYYLDGPLHQTEETYLIPPKVVEPFDQGDFDHLLSQKLTNLIFKMRIQRGYIQTGAGSNSGGINTAQVASDIVFWAGKDQSNRVTAPFRVTAAGNVTVNNITIGTTIVTAATTDNLQTAINTLNTAGGGTLYLQTGTYTLGSSLTLYSNISIIGTGSGNTTIDFNTTANNATMTGTSVYTTGTIASIGGGVNVVGSGTTWTAAMIGQQIFINNRWYIIVNVVDATHLTLATGYADGATFAGTYRIATPIKNVTLTGMTIKNSTLTALVGTDVRDLNLNNVVFVSNNKGFSLTNLMNIGANQVTSASSTSNGFELTNGSFCNFLQVAAVSNGGSGAVLNNIKSSPFYFSAADSNTVDGYNCTSVTNCVFEIEAASNTGIGIQFVSGCNNNFITESLITSNISDGIKLTASSSNNTIGGAINITGSGGWGINIANANDNNNTIIVPYFATNTSGNLQDLGTGTNQVLTAISSNSQTFTANGTWTKPSGITAVQVTCIGAGGGGGGGASNSAATGGGGGGGGGFYGTRIFKASDLGATVAVTVGSGGTAGAGGTGGLNNAAGGGAGGNSLFGTVLTAYGGGGGGAGNQAGNAPGGGGGGGSGGVGPNGVNNTATIGGVPATGTGNGINGQGGGSIIVSPYNGSNSEFGGGGGGNSFNDVTMGPGGSSLFGAAGGGGGGYHDGINARAGGVGGNVQSYVAGGGGGGGASGNPGVVGTAGMAGTSLLCGTGGGGGGASTGASAGGAGGAGGAIGGGGGGGGANRNSGAGGAGGVGGRGEIRIIAW
ncbi:MAG TPA: hypothetical protein VF974_04895 [Patescibacteria group bacterium]